MSSIGCSEFIGQLDSWMEGERQPAARAHVQDCEACRGFAADLDAIQSAAPTLSVADPEPPARVWTALRAQLIEEGLIPENVPVSAVEEKSWFTRLFASVPRPALAGGYLALLVALAFGLSNPFAPHTSAPPSFPLSAELDSAEQTTVSSFVSSKSPISASLHQNLEIVDHYIALCEKSVREEPENDAARQYLYQAYQQKADLIALITERGDLIQ
jgi:hypothetical protein